MLAVAWRTDASMPLGVPRTFTILQLLLMKVEGTSMFAHNGSWPRGVAGKRVAVTGTFSDRRKMLQRLRDAGASVESIVHRRLDWVIATEEAIRKRTQRVRKACRLGVPLVTQYDVETYAAAGNTGPATALRKITRADALSSQRPRATKPDGMDAKRPCLRTALLRRGHHKRCFWRSYSGSPLRHLLLG